MARRVTLSRRVLPLLFLLFVPFVGCGSSDSSKDRPSYKDMVVQTQRLTSPEARSRQLARIGGRQAKAGDTFGAEVTLEMAAVASREIEDADARIRATVFLAEQLSIIGKKMEAAEILEPLVSVAEKIESIEVRAGALAAIANAQATAGRLSAAQKNLTVAEGLLDQLDDVFGQVLVQGGIAKAFQKMERPEEVQRVTADFLQRARSAGDDRARANCLALAGAHLRKLGDQEGARKTLGEAITAARAIENPQSKAYSMCDIATKLGEAGYRKTAHGLLEEANAVADTISDRDQQIQIAEKVRTLMLKIPR